MNLLCILVAILLITSNAVAALDSTSTSEQNSGAASQTIQTLIPSGEIESGGFGALVMKFGPMDGDVGILVGARGGWVINRTFVLGGGGYGYTNATYYGQNSVDTNIAFGYGGLELEYLINSNSMLHATILTHIGAGGFTVFRHYQYDDVGSHGSSLYTAACFVFEPAVNIEANILTWMRIQVGVGYRLVSGIDATIGNRRYDNSTVSGPFGVAAIKFGPY